MIILILLYKAFENGTAETSGVETLWKMRLGHLTDIHIAYFKKWLRLVDIENLDFFRAQKDIWSMSGTERESKSGNSLGNMKVSNPFVKFVSLLA